MAERTVLRARIGVADLPPGLSVEDACEAFAEAVRIAADDLGMRLDCLELDLAVRPDWERGGPGNRLQHV